MKRVCDVLDDLLKSHEEWIRGSIIRARMVHDVEVIYLEIKEEFEEGSFHTIRVAVPGVTDLDDRLMRTVLDDAAWFVSRVAAEPEYGVSMNLFTDTAARLIPKLPGLNAAGERRSRHRPLFEGPDGR